MAQSPRRISTSRSRRPGKTIGTLEQELEKEYVPRIYRTINVTIRTADRFYFVGGEVRQPSRQLYVGRITVTQAIQSAGDFTDFANQRKVRVIRANNKVQIVDCEAALEDPTKDALIYPGDRIVVDSKIFLKIRIERLDGDATEEQIEARRFLFTLGQSNDCHHRIEAKGVWPHHLTLEDAGEKGIRQAPAGSDPARQRSDCCQERSTSKWGCD